MLAYTDELQALLTADGDFVALRAQMDDERKAKMLVRYEVCLFPRLARVCFQCLTIIQHAKACYAAEDARSENREVELGDLKKTRFEQYAQSCSLLNAISSFQQDQIQTA